MLYMKKIYLYIIILIFFMNYLYSNNSDTLKNVKENNDSWKVSLLPFAYNIPSLGQFNNNKPLKGLSLMAMKYYWYNEFNEAKKENSISDRNRAFWWFVFLYFYSAIDAYIDSQLNLDRDDLNQIEEEVN